MIRCPFCEGGSKLYEFENCKCPMCDADSLTKEDAEIELYELLVKMCRMLKRIHRGLADTSDVLYRLKSRVDMRI